MQHSHSCGDHEQANACGPRGVCSKKEFASAVGLHPTNNEAASNPLSEPRGEVGCKQCVDSSVDDMIRHNGNGEADSATTLDVNPNTADASRARGWLERNEIVATRSEVDRAGRIDYPEVREVTAGGEA